jgi:glucose-1-phosphate adenylyltransferase
MTVDENNRIIRFLEKPDDPEPMPGSTDTALASMGIYVFDTDFLCDKLIADAADPSSAHDFGRNVVPGSIDLQQRVYAYPFHDVETKAQSYWRDVGTVDGFFKANLELAQVRPELNLYDDQWPIWTYQEQLPPAKFILDQPGRHGTAYNSLVSGGCIVSGAEVRESVLFWSVRVREASKLLRVVVLPRASIGANCRITQAIIDADCVIPDGTVIGENAEEDARRFWRTEEGVVLVCPHMLH